MEYNLQNVLHTKVLPLINHYGRVICDFRIFVRDITNDDIVGNVGTVLRSVETIHWGLTEKIWNEFLTNQTLGFAMN